MASIFIKVTNRLGEFAGTMDLPADTTKEQAMNVARSMVSGINDVKWLSLSQTDGSTTVFPQAILAESVLKLNILE